MVSSCFQCSFKTETNVNARRKAGGGGEGAQLLWLQMSNMALWVLPRAHWSFVARAEWKFVCVCVYVCV